MYQILYIPTGEFITKCPFGNKEYLNIHPYHPAKLLFNGVTVVKTASLTTAQEIIKKLCSNDELIWGKQPQPQTLEEEYEIIKVK